MVVKIANMLTNTPWCSPPPKFTHFHQNLCSKPYGFLEHLLWLLGVSSGFHRIHLYSSPFSDCHAGQLLAGTTEYRDGILEQL